MKNINYNEMTMEITVRNIKLLTIQSRAGPNPSRNSTTWDKRFKNPPPLGFKLVTFAPNRGMASALNHRWSRRNSDCIYGRSVGHAPVRCEPPGFESRGQRNF